MEEIHIVRYRVEGGGRRQIMVYDWTTGVAEVVLHEKADTPSCDGLNAVLDLMDPFTRLGDDYRWYGMSKIEYDAIMETHDEHEDRT